MVESFTIIHQTEAYQCGLWQAHGRHAYLAQPSMGERQRHTLETLDCSAHHCALVYTGRMGVHLGCAIGVRT